MITTPISRLRELGAMLPRRAMLTVVAVMALVLGVLAPSVQHRAAADETLESVSSFEDLRAKWFRLLTGGPEADLSIPEVADKALALGREGQTRWESLNTAVDRAYLWEEQQPSTTNSNWVNGSYNNVRSMALAFATEGSELHGDPDLRDAIVAALEWLDTNAYNEDIVEYGNWWNFQIGVQIRMGDILILMHDQLTEEQIGRFVSALDHFVTEIRPADTGANRADKILSKLLQMVAVEDSERMEYYRDSTAGLFEYVTVADGMYRDGSFVQHTDVASTGNYGEVLLRGVTNIAHLLDRSPWSLPAENLQVVAEWVFNSYEPVIFEGRFMDMVRGRSIATEEAERAAAATMGTILRISQFMSGPDAVRMRSLVKHWALANPGYNYVAQFPVDIIPFAAQVFSDPSVEAAGDFPIHREMANMGRSVHKADGWAFGVSMSSVRTQNYELTNGANGKGWYTGDGMTYLHTGDSDHFAQDFWPTVDWHRLPGTTVDTLPRHFDHYQYGDGEGSPKNVWAGGVSLGDYGASGMDLQQLVTDLEAKKSWFMFDDEVVAVGSGINSGSGRAVETIVEQRQLDEVGSNTFTVNGETRLAEMGASESLEDVEWAHLEGTVPGSGIGYYFPQAASVEAKRMEQSGSWYDINRNPGIPEEVIRSNYLTLTLEHGSNPEGAGYGYVLLPNREASEVTAYAAAPDIDVLESSPSVHAVRENNLNLTAANFFDNAPTSAADLITVNRSASVIVEEGADHGLSVGVSDPTFQNTGAILVEINRSAGAVLEADPRVEVLALHPTIKLLVDVGGAAGATSLVRFDTDPDLPREASSFEFSTPFGGPGELEGGLLTYASHDFEVDPAFNRPGGWVAEDDPGTISLVTERPGSENHVARLHDGSTSGSARITKHFDPQDEYVEIAFDWAEPKGTSGATVSVIGGGDLVLELVSRDGGVFASVDGELVPLIEQADATRWYRIKLALDITLRSAEVWVDGQLQQVGLHTGGEGVVDAVTFATGETSVLPLLVDNFLVPIHGGVSVLRETFDQIGTGLHPTGWSVKERLGSAPVKVVEEPSESNKSLLLDDNDAKFTTEANRTFARQTGRFTFGWKFLEPTSGKWPTFVLGDGATDGIRFQSNGLMLKLADPEGVMEDVGKLGVGTWHAVRLEVDAAAGEFDLYLNDELIRSAAPFVEDVSGVDQFRVRTSYGAVNAPLYLDEVDLHKVVPVVSGVMDGESYSAPVTPVFKLGEGRLSVDGGTPVAFDSGTTLAQPGEYVLEVTLLDGASLEVAFQVVQPPVPAWDPWVVYYEGDVVSFHGSDHVAQWWTQNQEPGAVSGSWMEQGEPVPAAGVDIREWTPSWVYSTGGRVAHGGHLWQAQWWSRNQQPGDVNGPWLDLGPY